MPCIPAKVHLLKWVYTLVLYPACGALVRWIVNLFLYPLLYFLSL